MQLEEHHVFFTLGNASMPDAVEQLEPWLSSNAIRPIECRHTVTPTGEVELQLTFKTRQEARLFEQAFCQADQA